MDDINGDRMRHSMPGSLFYQAADERPYLCYKDLWGEVFSGEARVYVVVVDVSVTQVPEPNQTPRIRVNNSK